MSLTIVIGYEPLVVELHTHIQAVYSLSYDFLSLKKCPKLGVTQLKMQVVDFYRDAVVRRTNQVLLKSYT